MYMITYTTYLHYLATYSVDQLSDVRMNTLKVCLTNKRTRIFDVKHQMYVEFTQ